ncbi:hypothetical protein B0H16DRAFT_1451518 [Mycena metata]|uniref:Uncharacterized protein n=1 Tax=Mycena metata TaxID=1033252 RepID=A0AAD7JZA7_9AGAR|nr:hypothetical protein B0H16DRAFT_1451518 [Mycena metata]
MPKINTPWFQHALFIEMCFFGAAKQPSGGQTGRRLKSESNALMRQTVGRVPRLTEALPRRTKPKIGRCPQALDAVKRGKNPYVGTASMHPRPMSAQKCPSGLGRCADAAPERSETQVKHRNNTPVKSTK